MGPRAHRRRVGGQNRRGVKYYYSYCYYYYYYYSCSWAECELGPRSADQACDWGNRFTRV